MKKILTLLLGIILLVSLISIMVKGNNHLKISSIKQIIDKSNKLDANIEQASILSKTNYPDAIKSLEDANKELVKNKDEYVELVNTSLDEDLKLANEIQKYDIDFLWTIIGSHATHRDLQLGLEVVRSNSITQNEYDLKFTIKGEYKNISDFIKDIEDDSELNFKIEDFNLQPTKTKQGGLDYVDYTYLTCKFSVKNIGLNLDTLK